MVTALRYHTGMLRMTRLHRLVAILILAAGCDRATEEAALSGAPASLEYSGRESCRGCHQQEDERWQGSHHDLAMQVADASTVLGDFGEARFTHAGVISTFFVREGRYFVRTDGPDGALTEFPISHTFGVEPLQQYLVEFPEGRLQALSISWDSRPAEEGGQKWFHLYPDEEIDYRDPLHWTKRLQNWNYMCAECHSTNLRRNYRLEEKRYQTSFSEMDVSCEACHGPGSAHVAWAKEPSSTSGGAKGLVASLSAKDGGVWVTDIETGLSKRDPSRQSRSEIETCARCHSRRSNWSEDYLPGGPLLDTHRLALLDESLYFADGQMQDEVYVYGSFIQSKMYREGVSCNDCHDPHSLKLRSTGNGVCASCHLPSKFDAQSHHFHPPDSRGALCVECHMPSRDYMVVDPRRDHSFRLPRPQLSAAIGAPDACTHCHSDRSQDWAASEIALRFGEGKKAHFGEALQAGRAGLPGATEALERLAGDPGEPGIARATALTLLAHQPGRGTLNVVQKVLRDTDPLVRFGAVQAAEAFAPEVRHPLVYPLLQDPVLSVRLQAAQSLASVPREILTPDQRAVFDNVLAEYRASQRVNADTPESHLNIAVVELEQDNLEAAEAAYGMALAIDPDFVAAYVNLADLYRLEGRDPEGEALLHEALERHPAEASLHHALGLLLVRRKRLEQAIPSLERAASLQPENARYSYVHAVALQSSGDVETALTVLRTSLAHHPYDRDLLTAIVAMSRDRGAIEEAVRNARRLLELAPEDQGLRQLLTQLEKTNQ